MFVVQNFIDRLENLCNENGITINKLATLSGITQSTIDSIIKGKSNNPRIETLVKIADYFCVSVDYLIGRSDDPRRL